jgi:transketolase
MVAVYWSGLNLSTSAPDAPDRDRFILSKGHAAPALYACLARRGYFPIGDLARFNQPGSPLPEQPSPRSVPGVEAATGSLGHGLSLGLGMALASRIQSRPYRVIVLLSDGECNEGTVWEAALFAAAKGLDNVTVLIDFNRWQATDRSTDVMAIEPLADKWRAFGWSAVEVNGHDIAEIRSQLVSAPLQTGRPTAIIGHTIKGRGVSFMEDDNNWHYRIPNDAELRAALAELEATDHA